MTEPGTQILWLMIVALAFGAASALLAYMSRWQAALVSLAALLMGYFSGYAPLPVSELWFWVGATAIVMAINYLLPGEVRDSRRGVGYFATGALVGAALGMMLNTGAGIITGSALGVVLGAVAYSRTPGGQPMGFGTRQFFNYLCAKGLPIVVTFSMLGILSLLILSANKL